MLLQNTTTNACESWHRQLKASPGVDKGKVSNQGKLQSESSHGQVTIFQLLRYLWYDSTYHAVLKERD